MFIDEWFQNFYKELPLNYGSTFKFGQIYRTHAYYPHENLQFWRPLENADEQTKTAATHFQIEAAGHDAFNKSLPLHSPKLKTNEEFLVVRAKTRPVLLIMPEVRVGPVINRGFRGKLDRHKCTVAQIFGLADTITEDAKFSPDFVERLRKMEFPQFMFLPKCGILPVDSLLRLDELQSVFVPHLDATKFMLDDEIADLLRDQIQFLFTNKGPNSFTELRECLLKE